MKSIDDVLLAHLNHDTISSASPLGGYIRLFVLSPGTLNPVAVYDVPQPSPTLGNIALSFREAAQTTLGTEISDSEIAVRIGESRQNFAKACGGSVTIDRVHQWIERWNLYNPAVMLAQAGGQPRVYPVVQVYFRLEIPHADVPTTRARIQDVNRALRWVPGVGGIVMAGNEFGPNEKSVLVSYQTASLSAEYAKAAVRFTLSNFHDVVVL